MHKKWTDRVEQAKKTSHCKSRVFLRKRRLKIYCALKLFQAKMGFSNFLVPRCRIGIVFERFGIWVCIETSKAANGIDSNQTLFHLNQNLYQCLANQ